MISAKFLWGNVLLGGKLQIGVKSSNFEIFESALYMKSVSMPLSRNEMWYAADNQNYMCDMCKKDF